MCSLSPAVATSVETAVELARTHLTEARRSVGALRPSVGKGESIATALKRLADLGQRTDSVPIDIVVDELPRYGDGVEREILAIAQEALTNAVRHSGANGSPFAHPALTPSGCACRWPTMAAGSRGSRPAGLA